MRVRIWFGYRVHTAIQAAILDETLPDTVSLFDLASDTPLVWEERRARTANPT